MERTFSRLMNKLETKGAADILKYASVPGVIPLSAGSPSQEAFPTKELAEIAAAVFREEAVTALQYNPTEGYPPLRAFLPSWLKEKYGVGGQGDALVLTSGAQQVMHLAAACLVDEGDTVLCEDPSFVGSINAFRATGANVVGIPMEDDGIDTDALEQALETQPRVRLLYTIPNFQNPTGITMSLEKRRKVYELARRHGVTVLEDNPYGDLRYEGEDLPAIKTFDTEGVVIYAGSFSKVIAPGLRVGYALADKALAEMMGQIKLCDDVHTAALSQMLCYRYLTQYDFEAHLGELRRLYAQRCAFAKKCFAKHLAPYGVTCAPAQGGLFLWLTLPQSIPMKDFCTAAVRDHQVAVVPGTTFTVDPDSPIQGFRVNFSAPSYEALEEGFVRLEACLRTFF